MRLSPLAIASLVVSGNVRCCHNISMYVYSYIYVNNIYIYILYMYTASIHSYFMFCLGKPAHTHLHEHCSTTGNVDRQIQQTTWDDDEWQYPMFNHFKHASQITSCHESIFSMKTNLDIKKKRRKNKQKHTPILQSLQMEFYIGNPYKWPKINL